MAGGCQTPFWARTRFRVLVGPGPRTQVRSPVLGHFRAGVFFVSIPTPGTRLPTGAGRQFAPTKGRPSWKKCRGRRLLQPGAAGVGIPAGGRPRNVAPCACSLAQTGPNHDSHLVPNSKDFGGHPESFLCRSVRQERPDRAGWGAGGEPGKSRLGGPVRWVSVAPRERIRYIPFLSAVWIDWTPPSRVFAARRRCSCSSTPNDRRKTAKTEGLP